MINWSFLWDIELRNNYLLQQLSDANVHNSSGLMSRRQRKENKCSPSSSPGQWALGRHFIATHQTMKRIWRNEETDLEIIPVDQHNWWTK